MVVLNKEEYNKIMNFIKKYPGLAMECEKDLIKAYPEFSQYPDLFGSLLSKNGQLKQRYMHQRFTQRAPAFLEEYYNRTQVETPDKVLLEMAKRLQYPPFGLCRIILAEKYKSRTKSDLKEMLRDPNLIPDPLLGANVSYCIYSDYQDGIIIDLVRHCIGEEYEVRLKEMAKKAGLQFFDENDLRRTGHDKTPDMKMAVPFIYKNQTVYWIESKASFGDLDSHTKYVKDQLISYKNRFGCGIVIYWFGYHEEIQSYPENGDLIILDSFPEELTLLKFDENIL